MVVVGAIATLTTGLAAPKLSANETPLQLAQSSLAQSNNDFDTQEMLDAHNEWRSKVGVSNLTWSSELATYASEWANDLAARDFTMEHRSEGRYGENLYWGAGQSATPTDVVNDWGEEVNNYNYSNNSCSGVCGHYTQVVWNRTTEVGCAVARGTHPDYGTQEIWVCNYNPPGNYVGRKPY